VIGQIPDGPQVKYLIVAWDTESDDIDFDAPNMSCFDAAGVLSVAFGLAGARLPNYDYEPEESE
jgi:hypothetical protein